MKHVYVKDFIVAAMNAWLLRGILGVLVGIIGISVVICLI
jgi:hypothetical protein